MQGLLREPQNTKMFLNIKTQGILKRSLRSSKDCENTAKHSGSRVESALQQDDEPRITSRRNGLGLSQSSFNRISRIDLQWHPYKMIRRHKMSEDYPRRVNFCNWLLARPPRFLEDLCIGDESSFCLNGFISTHSVRKYAPRGQKPIDSAFEKMDARQ